MGVGNVNEENVLLNGVANVAITIGVGELGYFAKLCGSDSPAQNGGANVIESGLLLMVNTQMVAVNVERNFFGLGRIELKPDLPFEFVEKALCRPAVLQEKVFQAGFVAALAKDFAGAEDLRNASCDGNDLVLPDEAVQFHGEMWLGRESAADADIKTNFPLSVAVSRRGRKRYVVNFRIAAPVAATRDCHLEFARQIVEFAIAAELFVNCERERRRVNDLVAVNSSNGTTGDVARDVSARTGRRQPNPLKAVNQIMNVFDRHPMQLDVLPCGDVRNAS